MLAEEISYNQYSSYNRALFSDALLIKYSTDAFDLTATTSYQYLDDIQDIDQDFTTDSLFFISQKQKQNMLSQEVLIRSNGKNRYNWLFGAYGFYQAFDNAVDVDQYAASLSYLKTYNHDIAGYAFFHQSSLKDFITKGLTITGGIRIDSEDDQLYYTYDRNLRGVQSNLADTIYPSLESLEIIPRLAVNYTLMKSNLYLVLARGYKTGGFNSTFERPEDLTFDPEYSWNYEIGIKTPLLKNFIYADIAIFYIDWKDQQVYQTVPSGRGAMLKNAGHSVSKGGELSFKTRPVKGLEFNISYGYTNATFISYELNETTNYNGNYLPYVPRHTVSFQTTKSIPIHNSVLLDNIRLNILYRGAGKIYWNEKNSVSQPYYGLLDARVSFIKGAMQCDIWAKNLLNTYYEAFYFEALGNKYVQTGKPAQIGINLSVKF
jgi:outer membrane receptor for monomeric catechols